MEKIDWLARAKEYLTIDGNMKPSMENALISIADSQFAQACIAMHNAEREQERPVINIPSVWVDPINKSVSPTMTSASYEQAQPQPFDCEEVARSLDVLAKEGNRIKWLRSYVRSLGYPVKE